MKAHRNKEKGEGWKTGSQPYDYPASKKGAGVGAYEKSGKGHGTPQAGGKAGYPEWGSERTANWPSA
jgi:hypothetical protein